MKKNLIYSNIGEKKMGSKIKFTKMELFNIITVIDKTIIDIRERLIWEPRNNPEINTIDCLPIYDTYIGIRTKLLMLYGTEDDK